MMIRILFTLSLFLCCQLAIAQPSQQAVQVYDVVYLKNGQILKGEIVVFEESDGDLTFRDQYGRNYSITRKEYDYFTRDVRYAVRSNDTLMIRPRKENAFEIGMGFNVNYISIHQDLTSDKNYPGALYKTNIAPICFRVGVGKYLGRQHFVGATAEIDLLSEAKNYFQFSLRYSHQYDGYKRNVAFYIPVELQFSHFDYESQLDKRDSTLISGTYSYHNNSMTFTRSITSVAFQFGQGLSFILHNKKSINLELLFQKHFVVAEKFVDMPDPQPVMSNRMNGFKFALIYNF